MTSDKTNLEEKFIPFTEHWKPKIVGELNVQLVKLVMLKGEFVWNAHSNEHELFYVIDGTLKIEFNTKEVLLHKDEFIIVPTGVVNKPVAIKECFIMLFEPKSNVNMENNTKCTKRSVPKYSRAASPLFIIK